MFSRQHRTKVAPTHYPRVPFHGLRSAQLISSLVVGAITFFFDWHLRHDKWSIPWTFIILTAVACLTILFLTATIVLHCCFGLNPRFNIFLNIVLVCLWGLGFGLLTWWARNTLGHECSMEKWSDDAGVMVCRIYKALFTFSMTGFISTVAALSLDIWVFKRATARGKYGAMRERKVNTKDAFSSSYRDSHDSVRTSEDVGRFNGQAKIEAKAVGYEVPQEQFSYDTSYRGAAGRRED